MTDVGSADSTMATATLRGTVRMEESLANELLGLLVGTGSDAAAMGTGIARAAAARAVPRIGPVRFRDHWVELDFEWSGTATAG